MDYTVLYETFEYGKQYAWIFIKNELLPELKMRVAKLKRMNQKNEENAKRIALMLKNNPLHGAITYTPPGNSFDWREEEERVSYDRYIACVERNF